MCFDQSGILFDEFEKIFSDTFSRRAPVYKQLVAALADGRQTFSSVCDEIDKTPTGTISGYLSDLCASGFIAIDRQYSLDTGKKDKHSRYRLRDNYVRFYLKYIEPERDKIERGLYRHISVENLSNFEIIMGFQLENLVLNNLDLVLEKLRIAPETVKSASPYFQTKTQRQESCQIDLLIHTKHTIYICEIRFRKKVTAKVIKEVSDKIRKLKYPKHTSIRPVLIHVGGIASGVESEDYFDKILSLEELLLP